ncbi:hypothetical protein PPROV_000080200 [Pycnococcus provasolii]|uniref:Protein ENHANCED DISEASE RESISTANCE 2 C-terminal domain-containing protein n=2 Tax=Pycnococcus provasolii TaxID=41880 RepID=A0A830H4I3_9CHLO|nr:hypothetical protein PPROV_000080200 [Pycnococcus provasolii]
MASFFLPRCFGRRADVADSPGRRVRDAEDSNQADRQIGEGGAGVTTTTTTNTGEHAVGSMSARLMAIPGAVWSGTTSAASAVASAAATTGSMLIDVPRTLSSALSFGSGARVAPAPQPMPLQVDNNDEAKEGEDIDDDGQTDSEPCSFRSARSHVTRGSSLISSFQRLGSAFIRSHSWMAKRAVRNAACEDEDDLTRARGDLCNRLDALAARADEDQQPITTGDDQTVCESSLPASMYSESPEMWNLRGSDYLTDGVKIPFSSSDSAFELVAADLVDGADHSKLPAVAQPWSWLYRKRSVPTDSEFTFVVYLMVPPGLALVLYFQPRPGSTAVHHHHPVGRLLRRFASGFTEDQNAMFKLIPKISGGPWLVRQAVPQKPALLGRKIEQFYSVGMKGEYIEVACNIASSTIAAHVVGLVGGATRALQTDLAFLLEGRQEDELPEHLIGTVRLDKMDLNSAKLASSFRER